MCAGKPHALHPVFHKFPQCCLCHLSLSLFSPNYGQKFVSCTVGIQWVGYVMTAFGVLTAAQAVGLNYVAKFLSRRILFASAAMADLSVNMAMLLWDPTGTSVGSLFILPCVSGFAEGIFQAQFNCECLQVLAWI